MMLVSQVPAHPRPSGPSALLLLSVAQQAHVDEGPVAGSMIVAYLCASLMAFVQRGDDGRAGGAGAVVR